MNRLLPPGAYALLLIVAAGLWLLISPFALATQPAGRAWAPATVNAVLLGAILVVVAAGGILLTVALGLRDLVREAAARKGTEARVSAPPRLAHDHDTREWGHDGHTHAPAQRALPRHASASTGPLA
ncbi:MAG: hypothetical protein IVW57_13515 [Ktedonobacterales bacterium]|nr:hypothetical protein [Ktedonobacterales bacterium]